MNKDETAKNITSEILKGISNKEDMNQKSFEINDKYSIKLNDHSYYWRFDVINTETDKILTCENYRDEFYKYDSLYDIIKTCVYYV